ncbi:hypothetical protein SBD_2061 [Streptomyces bottropensis ATCC 25435]|uniref:SDR family oxidoreductase n=1 Tax=Streptomyces bottropensis ATCC 25435 TaxID=1054862 RepID=M3FU46_9ACTN|nr:hypothetical protein SBD_2061 [Streptomyces bottropensis ATCC 25435]
MGVPRHNNSDPVLVLGASSGFGFVLAQRLDAKGFPVVGAARPATPDDAIFNYRQTIVTHDDQLTRLVDGVLTPTSASHTRWSTARAAPPPCAARRRWSCGSSPNSSASRSRRTPPCPSLGHGQPSPHRPDRLERRTRAGGDPRLGQGATEQYARCLAQETEPLGIRVNVIGISAETPRPQAPHPACGHLRPHRGIPPLPVVDDNLALAEFILTQAQLVTGHTIEARQPQWI